MHLLVGWRCFGGDGGYLAADNGEIDQRLAAAVLLDVPAAAMVERGGARRQSNPRAVHGRAGTEAGAAGLVRSNWAVRC